jgi:hypothetical protein
VRATTQPETARGVWGHASPTIILKIRCNILPSEQFQRQKNVHFMFENIEFFSTEIRKKV